MCLARARVRAQTDYLAELRVVEPPAAARVGALGSVADYADYVDAVHAKWTGDGRGWDRWLDSHFGVQVTSGALDALVGPLRARNISWAARVGAERVGGGDDSLWTGGVSGQGFEFHGTIDFSEISRNTSGMDYCASPTLSLTSAR